MIEELTKEAFKKVFTDNFEMTNYAIHLAQEQIYAGNEDLNVTELLRDIIKHHQKIDKKVEIENIDNHV